MVAPGARLGLEASVGIAATKIAARLAARDGGGCAVIPPHEEWQFLAPLPIQLLAPDAGAAADAGALGHPHARRSRGAAGQRRGDAARPRRRALARRARGEDEHPLAPRPLPLHFEETAELDYGVDSLEPFLFVVRGLLDRLTARLALRGLICGDLRLSLGLAGRGRDERTVTVAAPSNELKPLLTLVRLHLEAHPPRDAVETVRLAAVPERLRADAARPLPPQRPGARPARRHPGAPRRAVRRRAPRRAGGGRFASAGCVWLAPFCVEPLSAFASDVGDCTVSTPNAQRRQREHRPLALRALRPPRALEVFYQRDQPDFVRLAADGRALRLRLHRPRRHPRRPLAPARRVVAPRRRSTATTTTPSSATAWCTGCSSTSPDQQWFVDGVYD